MSKLDKIIKIINKVVDLLDDDKIHDPIKEANKRESVYIDNSIILYFDSLIKKYHSLCLNRFNQVEQSKEYYLKWEGALHVIILLIDEFNTWVAKYNEGKEELCDEWKTWDECCREN